MSRQELGGYDYEFVDTPLDYLICNICHYPCRDSYLSSCCGHLFCKSCLEEVRIATTVTFACPICRSEEFATFPNKQVDRAVRSLHVYCTNKQRGCVWKGEVNNIINHLENSDGCQYEVVQCPNGCGKVLQRQYMTSHVETECSHDRLERLYYQAKHDLGSEKLQLLKLLIFGPPGAGKSSLLKVLLGGDPDPLRNSTGVCDRHLVQCMIAVGDHGCTWMKIELDNEIQRLRLKIEEKLTDGSYPSQPLQNIVHNPKRNSLNLEDIFFSQDDSSEQYPASNDMPFDIKQTSALIACYDSGGQPEFFDVMPALTTTPTGYVMVFDMSKDLSSKCVEHFRHGIKSSTESTVHYTNAELMKTALANIQSCTIPVSDERAASRLPTCGHLLVVGTHLDKCGDTKEEQDGKVLQIEKTIQTDILNLLVGSTVHVVERHNRALVYPISNTVKADRDKIAQEIRTAIENITDDEKTRDVPISWLLFQLEIRHTEKYYTSKSHCIDIATKCYIKEQDVDNILMYFHELGILLHYRNIPELQHVVFCDPQWLFDKLTKLIEVKYDSLHVMKNKISGVELKHENPHSINKKFKHGTFDKKFLCKLYSKDFNTSDVISYEHLCELFVSLDIMATLPGKTDQYFMPALLNPAPADIDVSLQCAFGEKIYDTLIIKFENRYIPRGVFCCLVVECMRNAIGWHVLYGDTAFKDLIIFQISTDLDLYVCLRDKIDSITLEMYHKSNNRLQMSPDELCHTLHKSLKQVCSQLKITDDFSLGFACQQYSCGGFICVPRQFHTQILSVCDTCDHHSHMQNEQLVWFRFLLQKGQLVPLHQAQCASLISNSTVTADNDKEVFKSNYDKFCSAMTDIENLLKYFITVNIINTDDQSEIFAIPRPSQKVEMLLKHISGSLEAGNTKPFRMMLDIMEKHGNLTTNQLAISVRKFLVTTTQDLPSLIAQQTTTTTTSIAIERETVTDNQSEQTDLSKQLKKTVLTHPLGEENSESKINALKGIRNILPWNILCWIILPVLLAAVVVFCTKYHFEGDVRY